MKRAGSLIAALWAAIVPALAAGGAVVILGACAGCESTVRQAAMPEVAAGSFDGVAADPAAHRLYLADSANKKLDVVDISSANPRFMRAVDLGAAPHGIAVAPDSHLVYAGLMGGAVAVIDVMDGSPKFMQVVTRITADPTNVDLLDYSAQTKHLFAATGQGGDVVAIDTTTSTVIRRYSLHVPVEQPRYNPADGMLYVSSPGTSSVVQINPDDGMTTRNYFMKGCRPFGLAINPANQLALAACGGSVALLNLKTGAHQVTQAVPGGDLVSYDSSADRFVVASPHGNKDSQVGVFDGAGAFMGSVAATPKARAAAFDPAHGVVYAPGPGGLMSFAPGACAPPPEWVKFLGGLSIFAVPLLAIAVVLFLYARRRPTRGPEQPSFHDLQEQDLALERERMRAFEDSVLGTPLSPGIQLEP